MEKLRKALEKRTAIFQLSKQKAADVSTKVFLYVLNCKSSLIVTPFKNGLAISERHGKRELTAPHRRARGKELCMAFPGPLAPECRIPAPAGLKLETA